MSFILDALKKSESERQRQNAPGIADVPLASETRSIPRWIWILSALLAVNTVVLIVLVMRPDAPGTNGELRVEQAAPAGTVDNAGTSFSEIVADAKRNRPQAEQQPAQSQDTSTQSVQPAYSPVASEPVPDPTPQSSVTDGLRSFNELRATGILQLPDLHLDIHVYAQQPADRFVFVNMSKYTEGSTLEEGPSVEEITVDGVVLRQSGTRFLLPRE